MSLYMYERVPFFLLRWMQSANMHLDGRPRGGGEGNPSTLAPTSFQYHMNNDEAYSHIHITVHCTLLDTHSPYFAITHGCHNGAFHHEWPHVYPQT